jgi:hypothetical protein
MPSHLCVARHDMDAGGSCAKALARMPALPGETLVASAGRGGQVAVLAGAPNGECSGTGRVSPAAEARP